MASSRRTLTTPGAVALLVLLVAASGCAKKQQPVTTPDLDDDAAPAPATAPSPSPSQAAAPTDDDPWSGDLESVNRYARETGLLGDVYFEYDRADLRADARERLAKNGDFLRRYPQFVVRVEGHCDERGTAEYNLALGQNRAGAAVDYVGQLGVDTGRLERISFGKERPECTDPEEACWWRNRKARFVIVGRAS